MPIGQIARSTARAAVSSRSIKAHGGRIGAVSTAGQTTAHWLSGRSQKDIRCYGVIDGYYVMMLFAEKECEDSQVSCSTLPLVHLATID